MKNPSIQKLLLVGAGHAHIGLLRCLSTASIANADIALISEQPQVIYSGMLPGWIAGHYQLDDISIDIMSLCKRAGVRFIQRPIIKVNAASCIVTTSNEEHFDDEHDNDRRVNIDYDYNVLSLNTGADTDMRWLNDSSAQNVSKITPIRPLSVFIERWQHIIDEAKQATSYRLAIVGGGAAAAELVMAAQVTLRHINRNHQAYLICGEHLLSGFDQRFKQRVIKQLERHDITVIHARATAYRDCSLLTIKDSLPMDTIIAATGVTGSAWTQHTDLDTVDH